MIVTNGRNMLRNFFNISRAEIKLLHRHISCASIVKPSQTKPRQHTILLRNNLIPPKHITTTYKIPSMSISTSNTSLMDKFDNSKNSENMRNAETSNDSNQNTTLDVHHEYTNKKDLLFDECATNNTFPLCDNPLPVIPRTTIISATTSMHLQVTTSPRQHYYSTSSIDSDQGRIGNQELHCPECEKM